jgi:hypothetical protein
MSCLVFQVMTYVGRGDGWMYIYVVKLFTQASEGTALA